MFPLALATAVPQVGLGLYETIKSAKALKNLQGQAQPQYSMSPEYQQYYNTTAQNANQGFTGAETAAFKQNVAQQQNTGFQQGVSMSGGNLAQALASGFKAQNIGAMNQFAGQDAQLHRQNIEAWGGAAGQMQQQQNLINQQKIQHRMQLESAYGGALKSGLGNITNGLMGGLGLGSMMQGQQNQSQQPPSYGYSSASYGMGNPSMNQNQAQQNIQNDQNSFYNADPTQKDFAPGGIFYSK